MTKKQLSHKITQLREPMTMNEWLKQIDLFKYCAAIKDYGFHDLADFQIATEADIEAMINNPDVNMKKLHRLYFIQNWKEKFGKLDIGDTWDEDMSDDDIFDKDQHTDCIKNLYQDLQSSQRVRMGVCGDGKPFVSAYDFLNFVAGKNQFNEYGGRTWKVLMVHTKYSQELEMLTTSQTIRSRDIPCVKITGIF